MNKYLFFTALLLGTGIIHGAAKTQPAQEKIAIPAIPNIDFSQSTFSVEDRSYREDDGSMTFVKEVQAVGPTITASVKLDPSIEKYAHQAPLLLQVPQEDATVIKRNFKNEGRVKYQLIIRNQPKMIESIQSPRSSSDIDLFIATGNKYDIENYNQGITSPYFRLEVVKKKKLFGYHYEAVLWTRWGKIVATKEGPEAEKLYKQVQGIYNQIVKRIAQQQKGAPSQQNLRVNCK